MICVLPVKLQGEVVLNVRVKEFEPLSLTSSTSKKELFCGVVSGVESISA